MVDVEPPEHKLQKVIVELRQMQRSTVMYVLDRSKLADAIEALEQADTRIASLVAERDALYMKLLDANHAVTEAGGRQEYQMYQGF